MLAAVIGSPGEEALAAEKFLKAGADSAAAALNTAEEEWEIDYSDIDASIEETEFDFGETVEDLVSGGDDGLFRSILDQLLSAVREEFQEKKVLLQSVIGIAAASAVFTLIAGSFQSGQAAQTGFFICYLALFGTLGTAFLTAAGVVGETVSKLLEFMEALLPAYVTVLAASGGTTAGAVFYQGTLVLISLADVVLIKLLLPLLNLYLALLLANQMSGEAFLSKFAGLIRDIVTLCLKVMLGLVVGFGGLKGMIVPAADALKKSALVKAAGAIPGVGGILEGVSQTVLGAAALLKNAVGAAGVIAICVICAVPVTQVLVSTAILKIGSAVIEPVADKRLVGAVSSCAGACGLLLNILLTAAGLFLIAVAIAAMAVRTI